MQVSGKWCLTGAGSALTIPLHSWRLGVAEDTAGTQRTWAEFHAPLKPADDIFLGYKIISFIGKCMTFVFCERSNLVEQKVFDFKVRVE